MRTSMPKLRVRTPSLKLSLKPGRSKVCKQQLQTRGRVSLNPACLCSEQPHRRCRNGETCLQYNTWPLHNVRLHTTWVSSKPGQQLGEVAQVRPALRWFDLQLCNSNGQTRLHNAQHCLVGLAGARSTSDTACPALQPRLCI